MKTVLLYSGGCHFCRWVARLLVRLDFWHELQVIPTRCVYALPYLSDVREDRRHENWWVISPSGCRYAGNKGGGIVMLQALTATRWLGTLLQWVNASHLLDRLDNWVKAHRSIFSRWVKDDYAPLKLGRFEREQWFYEVEYDLPKAA